MFTTKQLLLQLQLQDELNQQVHPKWMAQGWSWPTAAMMEGAELFDHLGWKWWKAPTPVNERQIQLELVDIWHFLLSACLEGHQGDHVVAAADLSRTLATVRNAQDDASVQALLKRFIADAAGGFINLNYLVPMMRRYGVVGDALHNLYVGKNVLNIFRQRHGYQDGTYVKTWHGREDNEVLAEMMTQYPDAAPDELLFMLEHTYSTLNANPNQLELNLSCAST